MRRLFLLMAVFVMAMSLTVGTAQADVVRVCTYASQQPTYKGWATLDYRACLQPG